MKVLKALKYPQQLLINVVVDQTSLWVVQVMEEPKLPWLFFGHQAHRDIQRFGKGGS